MAQEDFDRMIDEICSIKNIERTKAHNEACHLNVNGVAFTLAPAPNNDKVVDALGYFCNFGPLPDEQPHALMLRRLLESNLFMFGADMPRFTCNPETGNVMLVGRLPLAVMTGESMIQMMDQLAELAHQWGETHFLEDAEHSSRSGPTLFSVSSASRSALHRGRTN